MTTYNKDYAEIISRIYLKYNQDKVKDVSDLLIKYKGREEELLDSIFIKYTVTEEERKTFINPTIANATESPTAEIYIKPNESNRSTKKFAIIFFLLLIIIIALAIFFTTKKSDNNLSTNSTSGTNTIPQKDMLSINNTPATTDLSNFLSLFNLKHLVDLNEWDPNQIENSLNVTTIKWTYKGKVSDDPDDYQLGWVQEDLSIMFYHVNKAMWEYIFKDIKEANSVQRDLENSDFKIYSTERDSIHEATVYKNEPYIVILDQIKMTDGGYAYKIYIGNESNLKKGILPKINFTSSSQNDYQQSQDESDKPKLQTFNIPVTGETG